MSRRVWSLLLTSLVWAAVAASAVYWGLRLFSTPTPLPREAKLAEAGPRAGGDLSRLLGEPAAPAPAASAEAEPASDTRFQLIGVVAPRLPPGGRSVAEGVALIAVDGKPARAYRVGAAVDASLVLQTVHQRGATLGPRGAAATVSLTLEPPAPAATGSLPGVVNPAAIASPTYAPAPAPPQGVAPMRRGSQLPYVVVPPPQPGEPEQSPTSVPDPSQTR